jgi:hypothetical protein
MNHPFTSPQALKQALEYYQRRVRVRLVHDVQYPANDGPELGVGCKLLPGGHRVWQNAQIDEHLVGGRQMPCPVMTRPAGTIDISALNPVPGIGLLRGTTG